MSKRKQHRPEFKAKVALEALKGEETISELASRFGIHPTIIHQWKRALLEGASGVFERGGRKTPEVDEEQVKDLHAKIGELAVANDPRSSRGQVFWNASSNPGPASETQDDRSKSSQPVCRQAMCLAVDLPVVVLLRA